MQIFKFVKKNLIYLYIINLFLISNSYANLNNLDRALISEAYKKQQIDKSQSTNEQIKTQAQDLEAFFISKMLEPMFPENSTASIFGGSVGSDIYRTLMIEEYGKAVSKNGGIGIAKLLEDQLINEKEKNNE